MAATGQRLDETATMGMAGSDDEVCADTSESRHLPLSPSPQKLPPHPLPSIHPIPHPHLSAVNVVPPSTIKLHPVT